MTQTDKVSSSEKIQKNETNSPQKSVSSSKNTKEMAKNQAQYG